MGNPVHELISQHFESGIHGCRSLSRMLEPSGPDRSCVAGTLAPEASITGLTFSPVVIVVHMLVTILLPVEFIVAGRVFVHGGLIRALNRIAVCRWSVRR